MFSVFTFSSLPYRIRRPFCPKTSRNVDSFDQRIHFLVTFLSKINKCLPLWIIQFSFLDAAADCVE